MPLGRICANKFARTSALCNCQRSSRNASMQANLLAQVRPKSPSSVADCLHTLTHYGLRGRICASRFACADATWEAPRFSRGMARLYTQTSGRPQQTIFGDSVPKMVLCGDPLEELQQTFLNMFGGAFANFPCGAPMGPFTGSTEGIVKSALSPRH